MVKPNIIDEKDVGKEFAVKLEKQQIVDFINLSNVMDWMDQKDIFSLLDLVYKKLNKNGVCVIRKLLSDNIITTCNFIIKDYTQLDKTNFYTQTLCLVKSENK